VDASLTTVKEIDQLKIHKNTESILTLYDYRQYRVVATLEQHSPRGSLVAIRVLGSLLKYRSEPAVRHG
jgi:hypothetical protein